MASLFEPKIVVKDSFEKTMASLKKANIRFIDNPETGVSVDDDDSWLEGRVLRVEDRKKYQLDMKNGMNFVKNDDLILLAYDESIIKYSMLAGKAYFTSHALVLVRPEDYMAMTLLTANFYSKSKTLCEKAGLKAVENEKRAALVDKVVDEISLLCDHSPEHSVVLIDGPLIAGDAYTYMIAAQDRFLKKDILSVFFVKNSNSNMVMDNTGDVEKDRFNSDMHWADSILDPGERTAFYKYTDVHNPNNTKVFCYLKFFRGSSPVRVEFFTKSFSHYRALINNVMDAILYLIYCQGNMKNPQVRPIAIAEMYARETLKLIDVNLLMKSTGLTPTMNEARGMEEEE